jgi:aryl-alcohol dehydrogenase-like predicted oxidoreductase
MTNLRELFKLPKRTFGFGCGPLGVHGFGDVDLAECRSAVAEALDNGVRIFDTSDAYGLGTSEEQLAMALGTERGKAVIITKGGIRFDRNKRAYYDSSPKWLEQAMLASLKRLKTDCVDVYQIHYWDNVTPLSESFSWLEEQCQAGHIRAYGISNHDLTQYQPEFFRSFPNCLTYSEEYSLINQAATDRYNAMEICQPGSLFLPTGVLAQGLLSGRYSDRSQFGENDRRSKGNYVNFDEASIGRHRDLFEMLDSNPAPNVALAIAWVYYSLPNALPLVGIKSRLQLNDALAAANLDENSEYWSTIISATASGGTAND